MQKTKMRGDGRSGWRIPNAVSLLRGSWHFILVSLSVSLSISLSISLSTLATVSKAKTAATQGHALAMMHCSAAKLRLRLQVGGRSLGLEVPVCEGRRGCVG
jgi:hypothetical protein